MMELAPIVEKLRVAREATHAEIGRLTTVLAALDDSIALLTGAAKGAAEPSAEKVPESTLPAPKPAPNRDDSEPGSTRRPWAHDDPELRRLLTAGVSHQEIATKLDRSVGSVDQHVYKLRKEGALERRRPGRRPAKEKRQPKRRFGEHFEANPDEVKGLDPDHPALSEARTIFTSTVVAAGESPRLLVSGANQRKIGDRVAKGPWAGMPIYCLTLEERATCPDTCHHWATCYGNGMPKARRHRHGPKLQAALTNELIGLAGGHPDGFVVRLHILGDFYSKDYAHCWGDWLELVPALHVFGYTARKPDTPIGRIIDKLNTAHPDRFVIRWSDPEPGPMRATTIWRKPETAVVPEGIVCPAQTGATACCGSCGLCWSPAAKDKSIAFIAHGQSFAGRPPKPANLKENAKALQPWPAERRVEEPEPGVEPKAAPARPVPADTPFKTPLDRRCVRCQQIFKSVRASETLCTFCTGGAQRSAQTLGEWARA